MWDTLRAHSTPVELALSILASVAFIVSLYSLWDAHCDSQILTDAKVNGPRRITVDNNILQEELRCGIAVVLVMTSVAFLLSEPPFQMFFGRVAWILVSIMVVLSSFGNRKSRKQLRKYTLEERQTPRHTVVNISLDKRAEDDLREDR